ncbi:TniQ family protein [Streptomyces sp. NPDC015184]|uniref:TniQ family protein n=1 Tax=Streptomyces sp. NPDC015184 TaxID=3364946 RepID=UPI0036F7ECDA
MTAPSALPRSLVPLPGEGLAGYLPRLAHRLDRSPARILQLTGVSATTGTTPRMPTQLLVALPALGRASLIRTARITDRETEGLTLAPWASHYPPISESLVPRPRQTPVLDNWIYSTFTRYCPQCLAGDGSPIQQQHGGPWKIQWRLPIAFCCPTHQAFLQDQCPQCQLPAHAFSDNHSRPLPNLTRTGLHPAQCRNTDNRNITEPRSARQRPVCGARLDTVPVASAGSRASTEDLALQANLHALLEPQANPSASSRTFADLRVLAAVISATWPRAADFARDSVQANALDRHIQHARRTRLAPGAKISPNNTWDRPPSEAEATCALLQIGHTLLAFGQPELRDALGKLLEHGPPPADLIWGRTWRRLEAAGSPRLRQEFEPPVIIRHASRTLAPGPVAPERPGSYRPEHVPQQLPENWYTPLLKGPFQHYAGRHLVLRRTAAVRLVQLTTDMAMAQAAHYLGIPDNWLRYSLGSHRGGGPHLAKNPFAFDDALEAIAHLLDNLPDPTDYRHRRTQLDGWTLPRADWGAIRDQLPSTYHGMTRIKLDPYKHQCASTFIWTTVTGSERCLAPALPETPTDPAFQATWHARAGSLHHHLARSEGSYYKALRNLLTEYATGLARDIDQHLPKHPEEPVRTL